jgi:signal transduction histidine kinase
MNAVLGIGRLLADTQLTLEQQQFLNMINHSGNLLLTIINDILDYSKIEAGQLKLNFSSQNIADVCETAVHLVWDMAVSKGLQLAWSIDPILPPSRQLADNALVRCECSERSCCLGAFLLCDQSCWTPLDCSRCC